MPKKKKIIIIRINKIRTKKPRTAAPLKHRFRVVSCRVSECGREKEREHVRMKTRVWGGTVYALQKLLLYNYRRRVYCILYILHSHIYRWVIYGVPIHRAPKHTKLYTVTAVYHVTTSTTVNAYIIIIILCTRHSIFPYSSETFVNSNRRIVGAPRTGNVISFQNVSCKQGINIFLFFLPKTKTMAGVFKILFVPLARENWAYEAP